MITLPKDLLRFVAKVKIPRIAALERDSKILILGNKIISTDSARMHIGILSESISTPVAVSKVNIRQILKDCQTDDMFSMNTKNLECSLELLSRIKMVSESISIPGKQVCAFLKRGRRENRDDVSINILLAGRVLSFIYQTSSMSMPAPLGEFEIYVNRNYLITTLEGQNEDITITFVKFNLDMLGLWLEIGTDKCALIEPRKK